MEVQGAAGGEGVGDGTLYCTNGTFAYEGYDAPQMGRFVHVRLANKPSASLTHPRTRAAAAESLVSLPQKLGRHQTTSILHPTRRSMDRPLPGPRILSRSRFKHPIVIVNPLPGRRSADNGWYCSRRVACPPWTDPLQPCEFLLC